MQLGAAALIQQAEVVIYDDLGTQVRSSRPALDRKGRHFHLLDWDKRAQLQTEAPSQSILHCMKCISVRGFTFQNRSFHPDTPDDP